MYLSTPPPMTPSMTPTTSAPAPTMMTSAMTPTAPATTTSTPAPAMTPTAPTTSPMMTPSAPLSLSQGHNCKEDAQSQKNLNFTRVQINYSYIFSFQIIVKRLTNFTVEFMLIMNLGKSKFNLKMKLYDLEISFIFNEKMLNQTKKS